MTEWMAATVWALGLVAWFVIRLPHERRARRTGVVSHGRSTGDRLALAAAGIGLAPVPLVYLATGLFDFADYPFRPWIGWVGVVLEIAFLALFVASHRQLGRNFSVTLEIREQHKLVTGGLYRYVRHPMYSSFWLWALAQAFLLPNWVGGLSGLVGVGILYFHRVGKEEALMRQAFGEAYDAYCARTGRIIPRIR